VKFDEILAQFTKLRTLWM